MLDYYRFKEIYEAFLHGQCEEGRRMLMEMQSRYIALCDTNEILKYQLREFEDVLYLSKNMFFDGLCYWLMTGNLKQGPFCKACYHRDGALVRLESHHDRWECPLCGSLYDREKTQEHMKNKNLLSEKSPRIITFDKNFMQRSHAR